MKLIEESNFSSRRTTFAFTRLLFTISLLVKPLPRFSKKSRIIFTRADCPIFFPEFPFVYCNAFFIKNKHKKLQGLALQFFFKSLKIIISIQPWPHINSCWNFAQPPPQRRRASGRKIEPILVQFFLQQLQLSFSSLPLRLFSSHLLRSKARHPPNPLRLSIQDRGLL